MGASDFPRTTREEFERFVPHSDAAYMDKRPAWTKILAVWIDQAQRYITTFCLFYGKEHERERREALARLIKLPAVPDSDGPRLRAFGWLGGQVECRPKERGTPV